MALLKNSPCFLPFSPTLHSQSNSNPKTELGSSLFGRKRPRTGVLRPNPVIFGGYKSKRLSPVSSLGGLLGGFFKGNDTGEATRQQYAGTVSLINDLEPQMSRLSDAELREKTAALKERATSGVSLDSLLPRVRSLSRNGRKHVIC